MAAGSACIVSSKSADNNKTNPIGTGPFKYGNWNRGASLTLTRNDDYWGNKAKLTDVEFRFFSDGERDEQRAQGRRHRRDRPGRRARADRAVPAGPELHGRQRRRVGQGSWSRSTRPVAPLNDKRVRQALYAAIDRQAYIDGYSAGLAVPIGSHATPNDGEPYYADMTEREHVRPGKAKQLLAAAGQSNLKLRLAQVSAFPYAVRYTDILASQLAGHRRARSTCSRWSFRAGSSRSSRMPRTTT